MKPPSLPPKIASAPKAELHLHLEGSIHRLTLRTLMNRYGLKPDDQELRKRFGFHDFSGFLETFKWVTSFLRAPQDYALVARDLAEHLIAQGVVYAEITLSIGVMLLRKQVPQANFEALLRSTEPFERHGLHLRWIFDAVRQFGAQAAIPVVESAKDCRSDKIVAFGIGGDESSVRTAEFRPVYDRARELGLNALIHAVEMGGPENIRQAIELLGVERIGHGIAAVHDPELMHLLADKKIPLEICPTSNLRTGALAHQLKRESARTEDHPLPTLFRSGVPVVLSTDDPAMFRTTLEDEYASAVTMGLAENELSGIVQMSFDHAFFPAYKLRRV